MAQTKCLKCGGTGFWCKGYHNGEPYSETGFQCYGCGGTGVIGTEDTKEVWLNKSRINTIAANTYRVELRVINSEGKRIWRETVIETENVNWATQRACEKLGFKYL